MVRPPRQQLSPSSGRPADVIPLSPFRAEVGRGRRLRRADALLAEHDLESAVRALPGDELYYVVHELGQEEARPILAAATAEQLQVVLDFAVWQRDRLAPEALTEWVEAMACLLDNPVEGRELGATGRKLVEEHYSLNRLAPTLASYLKTFSR